MDPDLRDALAAAEDRHWWFEGRRRVLHDILAGLRPAPGCEILEIGCGSGANLEMLSRFGSVSAVEPDPADRRRAAGRGLAEVQPGTLPDELPFDGRFFDMIGLFDVLEHIESDVDALQAVKTRLGPEGTLILTVPAQPWLWSGHDEWNGHFRRYTRHSLDKVIREAGLRRLRISYFNTLLFPVVAAVRLLERLAGSRGGGTTVPPGPINRTLKTIFSWERHWLRRYDLPTGVSLLATATR